MRREGSGYSPSKAARDRVRGDEGAEHVGQAWGGNRTWGVGIGVRGMEPGDGETEVGGAAGGSPDLAPSLREGQNPPWSLPSSLRLILAPEL